MSSVGDSSDNVAVGSAAGSPKQQQLDQGYLTETETGDFFLGHTGQDCASVCFAAGRSCSSKLGHVGEDVFATLGIPTCKPLPSQLESATTSRYRFPGWVSADDNMYFGSCFNVAGSVGGDNVPCTDSWDAASRICHCPDESKSKAVGLLRLSGTVEAVLSAALLVYVLYALCKRFRRGGWPCCPPQQARFASIKDSFHDADDTGSIGNISAYLSDDDDDDDDDEDDDDDDSQGLLSVSPRHSSV